MAGAITFTQLRETEYWSIEAAVEHKIIKLVRSSQPMSTQAEVKEAFEGVLGVISMFPLHSWGLVLDMRKTRPAATLHLEDAIRQNRKKVSARFRRHATLLGTAAGVMQARRMLKKEPDPKINIFTEDAKAYAWAMGEDVD